jgi:tight adherence protein C
MNLLLVLGSASVVSAVVVMWLSLSGQRPRSVVDLGSAADQRELNLAPGALDRAVPMLERFGARLRAQMPAGRTAALAVKIRRAGMEEGWTVDRMLSVKLLLAMVAGAIAALRLVGSMSAFNVMLVFAGVAIGWFAPNAVLDGRLQRRQEAVRGALADMIDQLGVMVRAGLSIDAAVVRITKLGVGPLTDELRRVVQEMRVGVGRSAAMANMAERVDLPELRGFVSALSQADQLGVPVSDTLRVQADELRTRQRQHAEEQAMKLPVKILFPMVLCILPVLFIVVLGPAVMRISQQFTP